MMGDANPVGVEFRINKSFTFNPYRVEAIDDTLPRVKPVEL
jgi:hypothetical protein